MNFRRLEIFRTVVEKGGFTAAAASLRMAQPAVSLAVRKLESAVGARLLVRDRTGVRPTEAGQILLAHAQAIATHARDAQLQIRAVNTLQTGHVTLGAPPMVAASLLPGPLARFKKRHPGIGLTVRQDGAKTIEEAVHAGELDMGIVSDWHTATGLHIERLASRRMVACIQKRSAGRTRTLSWEQFLRRPLILFPPQYYQRQIIDHMCRVRGVRPDIKVETDAVPLMIELVSAGVGAATLLDAAAASYAGRIAILALPSEAVVPLALCARGPEYLGTVQRALWQHLKAELSA